jgi:NAD(P)-dependent dehydrogenase (short-subunit alcohol dehydrogenase family)
MAGRSRLRTFDGAVVIITGGAAGIGRALGEALGRRGAEVVLVLRAKRETAWRDLPVVQPPQGVVAGAAERRRAKRPVGLTGPSTRARCRP